MDTTERIVSVTQVDWISVDCLAYAAAGVEKTMIHLHGSGVSSEAIVNENM